MMLSAYAVLLVSYFMPHFTQTFRLLHNNLKEVLAERDSFGDEGWPKYRQFFEFLRLRLGWNASEREYRVLKTQCLGPAILVEGLLAYLVEYRSNRLNALITPKSSQEMEPNLVQYLLDQCTTVVDKELIRTDWRYHDTWRALPALVAATCAGREEEMLVRTSSEFETVSSWILTDVGRVLHSQPPFSGGADADLAAKYLSFGERHMGRTCKQFAEQLRRWWTRCGHVVMYACAGVDPIGVSVILPLEASAWHAVRDGRLSDLEITEDHVVTQSRFLLVLAMTTTWKNSSSFRTGWVTARQLASILFQAARLSWLENVDDTNGGDIRILAVGGSDYAVNRLQRHGYIRVGSLKGFDVPLYQLSIPDPANIPWLPRSPGHAMSLVFSALHMYLSRRK